jgi:D-alanyl-D-alanine carboxypeptidase
MPIVTPLIRYVALAAASVPFAISSVAAAPAIVIDAQTGDVIHAEEATVPWYPASLTKIMTAYVAMRMIADGRASFETPLRVSANAARQRPSKIGLRPGTELTLENALKMMMVKSANDVAVVIAEGLGGSIDGFAALMNAEARRLGLRETRFYNPNGLHHTSASTSARDMALLGRALWREFPSHRQMWGIGAISLGSRIFRNTNGLIGRYSGADGMKTGFICASGFNVVATASRGGRTLITVVLGAPSAKERTAVAMAMFDRGFNGSAAQGNAHALPVSSQAAPQDMRYHICGPGRKSREPLVDDAEFAVPAPAVTMMDNYNPALEMLPGARPAYGYGSTAGSRRAIAYGPRPEFAPTPVFIGRAPGSDAAPRPTSVAVRPGKVKPDPTAFAAQPPDKADSPTKPMAKALPGSTIKLTGEDADPKAKAKPGAKGKPAELKSTDLIGGIMAPDDEKPAEKTKAKGKPKKAAARKPAKPAAGKAKPAV